ncbi:EPIDERMAL PATTERNING FACTOR-like protein 2 [Mangifera indica]|uniref:EPIDERMAL PATTERNING FACTOR-like protein 2 n=1 Tax=Mangifera indica TaxID=29780 RepID=UPI001CFBC8D4|nr:EPIDERMAL PATTERNING FACTOR-like protein 2 [Mangifera indica]
MGFGLSFMYCQKPPSLSCFFFVLLIIASTQMGFKAEGRVYLKSFHFSQKVEEDNAFMVVEIGSRPPKCDLKCNSCGHCEAIQVPSNPAQNGRANSSTVAYNVANARGDDTTNYKPMSWKCKCGKYIFDP